MFERKYYADDSENAPAYYHKVKLIKDVKKFYSIGQFSLANCYIDSKAVDAWPFYQLTVTLIKLFYTLN